MFEESDMYIVYNFSGAGFIIVYVSSFISTKMFAKHSIGFIACLLIMIDFFKLFIDHWFDYWLLISVSFIILS